MTNIRRYPVANAPVFMTVVCHNRAPYLAGDRAKELLLAAMREVKHKLPFAMLGYVVLDDHLHWMIRLVNDTPRGLSADAARDVSPVEHMTRGANPAMSGSAAHTLTYADADGAMSGVGQVATNGSYLTPHVGRLMRQWSARTTLCVSNNGTNHP